MRKENFFRKVLAIFICTVMFFSGNGIFALENVCEETKDYIVILEEPALYSAERVTLFSARNEDYEKQARDSIISLQNEIIEKIPFSEDMSLRSQTNEPQCRFTDVLNGFTFAMTEETAEYVKTIDGVRDVIIDEEFDLGVGSDVEFGDDYLEELSSEVSSEAASEESSEETSEEAISKINSPNMINADFAYEKGYNGEGRAIAVVDSGLITGHEYFKISDATTVKYNKESITQILSSGDLGAYATADAVYKSDKIPFAYNYYNSNAAVETSQKHGVHVSGIAAGNGTKVADGLVHGVAPEAQILFFCVSNGTSIKTSVVVLALEDVVKFDVDSVNLSIGTDNMSENYENVLTEAAMNIENAGISMIFAAGNSGRISELTKDIDGSTTDNRCFGYSSNVASIKNQYSYTQYLENESGTLFPCGMWGNSGTFGLLETADCGNGTSEEIEAADVLGKVALVALPDKAIYTENDDDLFSKVISEGARAVVLINNSEDLKDTSSLSSSSVFVVSKSIGEELKKSTHLKFSAQKAVLQTEASPVVNDYSSYGYSDNLELSVDFAAPGGNIYSSYSTGTKAFANMSGTSMAAPHVTGAISLMYGYIEDTFPQYTTTSKHSLAKNLLASTAQSIYEKNGALSSVRKVGAGLINLEDAMSTKVILLDAEGGKSKLSIGDELSEEFKIRFYAQNLSESAITFNKTEVLLSTDDYKYYEDIGYAFSGVKKLTATTNGGAVTLSAGETKAITLTVNLLPEEISYLNQAMVNGFFVEGKVVLSESEQNCDVSIPVIGFYGNWAKQSIIDVENIAENFKYHGVTSDGVLVRGFANYDEGKTTMAYSKTPYDMSKNQFSLIKFQLKRNAYFTLKFDNKSIISNEFANKENEYSLKISQISPAERADYDKIIVELRLPYDTEGTNKEIIEIELYEDNEAPEFTDLYLYSKSGEKKVIITASDNDNLSAVISHGTNADGEIETGGEYINYKDNSVEIDITDLEDVSYVLYDSAYNATVFTPAIKIDVENSMAVFKNNTQSKLKGMCFIAVYDDNGKLEMVEALSDSVITFEAYDSRSYDISSLLNKNYKLFFWSNLESASPLCDLKTSAE